MFQSLRAEEPVQYQVILVLDPGPQHVRDSHVGQYSKGSMLRIGEWKGHGYDRDGKNDTRSERGACRA
jgi:hypothetical protein